MPTGAQPGEDWTVVLRRQPAHIVEGRPEGGYPTCTKSSAATAATTPYPDDSEVSPELQRIRGPYLMGAGIAACEEHLGLHEEPEVAHWTRR